MRLDLVIHAVRDDAERSLSVRSQYFRANLYVAIQCLRVGMVKWVQVTAGKEYGARGYRLYEERRTGVVASVVGRFQEISAQRSSFIDQVLFRMFGYVSRENHAERPVFQTQHQ